MRKPLISYFALVLPTSVTLRMALGSNQILPELPVIVPRKLPDLNEPAVEELLGADFLFSGSIVHSHVPTPRFDLNLPSSEVEPAPRLKSCQEPMATTGRNRCDYQCQRGQRDLVLDKTQSQFLSEKRRKIVSNPPARDSPQDPGSSVINASSPISHKDISESAVRLARNVRHATSSSNLDLPEPFDVFNWGYLRALPETEVRDTHLSTFDLWLSLSKDKDSTVLDRYQRLKLPYPPSLPVKVRHRIIFKIAMSVSNNKIAVDRYDIFSEQTIRPIRERLTLLGKSIEDSKYPGIPLPPKRIDEIVEYVGNVTKVTALLIIAILSLFKKHPRERLHTDLVEDILLFLKKFWEDTQKAKSALRENNKWVKKVSILLKAEDVEENESVYKYILTKGEYFHSMAWKITKHWVEENGKKFVLDFEWKDRFGGVIEVINKIIFYENYHNDKSFLNLWGEKKIE